MSHQPIGVFDSGVGGLTVFRSLEAALPHESLVYLGDTARVPYGPKSAETVERYALEAARFLNGHDVKMMIVACNSASSVALPALREQHSIPVLGVIGPGARRAATTTRSGKIGVIGTRGTIASDAYVRAIHEQAPDAEVLSRACPLFVPLAEEGWTQNDVARQVAETYLASLREAGVDTLVLGCTHYPLLKKIIGEVMGSDVKLIDSAEAVAAEVKQRLEEGEIQTTAGSTALDHHFFVTDAPAPFRRVAERFLGRPLGRLERAKIEGE